MPKFAFFVCLKKSLPHGQLMHKNAETMSWHIAGSVNERIQNINAHFA
jgi:hypothetical protein